MPRGAETFHSPILSEKRPVQAPLVAEVYGPVYAAQQKIGHALRAMFDSTRDRVDTDDTLSAPARRYVVALDRAKAALLGVSQAQAIESLATALAGADATYVHSGRERDPIAVRLELGSADKRGLQQARAWHTRSGKAQRSIARLHHHESYSIDHGADHSRSVM